MTKSVRLAIAQAVYFSIFIVFTVLGITATLLALLLLIGGSGLVETVFLGDEPVYLDERYVSMLFGVVFGGAFGAWVGLRAASIFSEGPGF